MEKVMDVIFILLSMPYQVYFSLLGMLCGVYLTFI